MISAHNLPKTRDERCVPQAWDEFESPCDFAQLPLTTADVASPMCEVELLGGRVGPGTQWSVMGGVAPPWEQARQLVVTPWDSGRSAGHHPLGWGCHLVIAP